MRDLDKELRENIKQQLYMHGKLSILFYKSIGCWMIHKWGDFEQLKFIHEETFNRYVKAGMIEEANSLTLMDLPKDEEMIFRILSCSSLEKTLKEVGLI